MKKSFLYVSLLAALLAGCGQRRPKDVIAQDRMERLLYDYHLTTALQATAPGGDNVRKGALRQYVFRKHGVSEAEFDSSMVWYTRHPKELAQIYSHLQERFKNEDEHASQLLSAREEGMTVTLPGDTVEMWNGDTYYRLEAGNPLFHVVTFSLTADTTFQSNDAIRWTVNYTFNQPSKRVARMGLSVIYTNDSVAGQVVNVVRSGCKSIYVPQDSAWNIRTIHGFVCLPADGPTDADVLLHDISLMRYHVPFDSTLLKKPEADTLTVASDSAVQITIATDSAPLNTPQRRLSPDELKRQGNEGSTHRPGMNNRRPGMTTAPTHRSGSSTARTGSAANRNGSSTTRTGTTNRKTTNPRRIDAK